MKGARYISTLVVVTAMVGLSFAESPLGKDSWALLVAGHGGSPDILNYPFQANVAHAYHTMIAEGIPADRIIVMMNDTAAHSPDNPMPGVLVNRPNGPNVYKGLKVDYTGDAVVAVNVLNVLSGKKDAMKGIGTGRVIESNSDTNVFVYFTDHGGPGYLIFNDFDHLHASDLHDTLKAMHEKNQYKKIIMFIEACFSGSMFDNLLEENTGVYAMTAAARDEAACMMYPVTHNTSLPIGVYLSCEFSSKLLEHMDREETGTKESLFHLFQHERTKVQSSHVNIYGDFSFGFDTLTPNALAPAQHWPPSNETVPCQSHPTEENDLISPALAYYRRRAKHTQHPEDIQRLNELIHRHKKGEELFEQLVEIAIQDDQLRATVNTQRLQLNRGIFPCYKDLIAQFTEDCFEANEYFRKHFHKFANLCVLQTDVTELKQRMASVCAPYKDSIPRLDI